MSKKYTIFIALLGTVCLMPHKITADDSYDQLIDAIKNIDERRVEAILTEQKLKQAKKMATKKDSYFAGKTPLRILADAYWHLGDDAATSRHKQLQQLSRQQRTLNIIKLLLEYGADIKDLADFSYQKGRLASLYDPFLAAQYNNMVLNPVKIRMK